MAEAEKQEAPGEGAAGAAPVAAVAKKSKLKKLLPFLGGTLLSAGLACLCAFVIWPKHAPPIDPEEAAKKAAATPLDKFEPARQFPLPVLVVNLADASQAVAGKMSIIIEVRTTKERDHLIAEECTATGKLHPKIRDALLTLFSGKSSADIKKANGKELLKLEIQDLLSGILFPDPAEGAVLGVYFTDFLVQAG